MSNSDIVDRINRIKAKWDKLSYVYCPLCKVGDQYKHLISETDMSGNRIKCCPACRDRLRELKALKKIEQLKKDKSMMSELKSTEDLNE